MMKIDKNGFINITSLDLQIPKFNKLLISRSTNMKV